MTEDMTDDIFADAVAGLTQARAHLRGEPTSGLVLHVPAEVDVGAIRKATGLSQPAFAGSIGVQVDTLRQWEQGRRQPQGPARVLLAMLAKNPRVVAETLDVASPAPRDANRMRSAKRVRVRIEA